MNYEITRQECEEIHERDNWQCCYIDDHADRCPNRSQEIAHGISKGKTGRQKIKSFWLLLFDEKLMLTGNKMDRIVHHPLNVWASCRKHNDYFNISSYEAVKEKLKEIKKDIDK